MYRMTLDTDRRDALVKAILAATVIFSLVLLTAQAYAASVTLSVNVQTSLTFTTANAGFASTGTNITPGTPLMATTTLSVLTNDSNGWNVTLSGDNKNSTNNNLQRVGDTTTQIADQTEWVSPGATTTAGNAVRDRKSVV